MPATGAIPSTVALLKAPEGSPAIFFESRLGPKLILLKTLGSSRLLDLIISLIKFPETLSSVSF